jgi:hypothetical protein
VQGYVEEQFADIDSEEELEDATLRDPLYTKKMKI